MSTVPDAPPPDLSEAAHRAEMAIDAALDLAIDLVAAAGGATEGDRALAEQARRDALQIAAALRELATRAHALAELAGEGDPQG